MAILLMMAFSAASILGCTFMKFTLNRDNKKLRAAYGGSGTTPNL